MHERVLRRLEAENLSVIAGLTPGAKPAPKRRGFVVGFDTEWDVRTGALVTVQFAMMIDDRPVARVYDAPASKLSIDALAHLVARFLADVGADVARRLTSVHLVAHFAGAELGMLDDALRDAEIRVISKAHFARMPSVEVDGRRWDLRIVDLFAIYKTSLKAIGDAVGLPKLDLTKEEIEDMAALRQRDPARFDAYAARDAEIAILAFDRLRAEMLARWGIDPLVYRTIASLALAVFRFAFLGQRAPVRWRIERRDGKDVRVVEHRALRTLALRAYWGGRNEAYVRGLHRGPVVDLDVASMYPHAALLQPLPNERTTWRMAKGSPSPLSDAEIDRVEGFACADFVFPRECRYPCLPVVQPGVEKLFFPLRGRTYCTLAEVRAARALGARVTLRDWWVFEPGDDERNHDVGRYMRHFLRAKAESASGSLAYVTNKLLLNALVGKLAERVEGDLTTSVERFGRRQGVMGLGALLAKSPAARGVLRAAPRVGSGFAPEWAALILGRARAIMASIIASSHALLVSTDGVVVPAEATLDESCDGLRTLRSVGSSLDTKTRGEGLWVGRERLYAVLGRSAEGAWTIAKVARHGMPGSDMEAGEDILMCLRAGSNAAKTRRRERLISATEAARRGLRVNASVVEERKAAFKWDAKRRLLDRDANIFTSLSDTAPYVTIGNATKATRLRLCVQARNASQRRKHGRNVADAAIHLLRKSDMSLKEIAKRTGTSKSWVHELKQKLMRQDPLFRRPQGPVGTQRALRSTASGRTRAGHEEQGADIS